MSATLPSITSIILPTEISFASVKSLYPPATPLTEEIIFDLVNFVKISSIKKAVRSPGLIPGT